MNRLPLRWMLLLLALFPLIAGAAEEQRTKIEIVPSATAVTPGGKGVLAVVVDIQKGFHSQSNTPLDKNAHKFEATLDGGKGPFRFGELIYPEGHIEDSAALGGKASVYSGRVIVYAPFTVAGDAKPGEADVTGSITYQLCDDSVCYQPEQKDLKATIKVAAPGEEIKKNRPELFEAYEKPPTPKPRGPAKPTIGPAATSATPGGSSFQWVPRTLYGALGTAFLAGILFNIVPCVLPVLPLKVLGFVEVAQHDRAKTITLATVFGLGIVTVFAALSLLVVVFKTIQWGQQFANPIFAWGMVVLLLAMALWMFGLFNINLPTGVYSFAPRHDTYFGNYSLGILTAVLSTPCTGPLFPPILLWAGQQPPTQGVAAMVMVGVGMAFPYVILSCFPGIARRFPRVGPWAELFKQMMGFIILAFAIYFAAGRLTTSELAWWTIVPVSLLAALYLTGRTAQLSRNAQAVAIASLIAVSLVSASVIWAANQSNLLAARTESVAWVPYSDGALEQARKEGKVALIKFTATWCFNCQTVEGTVYRDNKALAALRQHDVVTIKADLTRQDASGWAKLRQLSTSGGIPFTAIYLPDQEQPLKIEGIYSTSTLLQALNQHIPKDTTKAVASGN